MRYFVAPGEDTTAARARADADRGDVVALTDGVTHFDFKGDPQDPVVALLPGLTIPLAFWDDVAAELRQLGFATLAYSGFGRGLSDRPRARYERPMFARQLRELLSALSISRPHVVASSMGALVALEHVRTEPDSVRSLALSGPAGFNVAKNAVGLLPEHGPLAPLVGKHLLRRNVEQHLGHNVSRPEDLDRLRSMLREPFRIEGTMYGILSTLKHFPLRDQDALFDTKSAALPPAALFWGTEDRVTPISAFARASAILQPAVSAQFEGAGHMLPLEQPQLFAARVAAFIGQHA